MGDNTEIYTGVVKWFNNKTGYGFITCLDKEYQHKDIFVHHSALIAPNETYKYLVQGEYVEFRIKHDLNNKKHPISASYVTGIKNGHLFFFYHNSQPTEKLVSHKIPRSVGIKRYEH